MVPTSIIYVQPIDETDSLKSDGVLQSPPHSEIEVAVVSAYVKTVVVLYSRAYLLVYYNSANVFLCR